MIIQGSMTIDPAVMISASQTVSAQRSIIENCLSNIMKDADSLKSAWEGESANTYQNSIAKIRENSPEMLSVFQGYADDLHEIALSFLSEEEKRDLINTGLPNAFLA